MKARRVLVAVAALAVAVGVFWLRRPADQIDLHAIPGQNVLLITIDTLRADALGSYGGAAATPAIDRLAAEGVRFDFAHAHAVLTLTSHASILTGELPFRHGLRDNSGYRLPPNARTAATILKSAGYATAAFVSAFPLHSRFGLTNGFDLYDDRFGETREPTEFVMPERPAAAVVPLVRSWIAERRPAGKAGGTGEPGRAGEGALRGQPAAPALPARPAQPWFVWVHLFDPHAPYRPPAPFDVRYSQQPYLGEVAATDAALGPLLDDVRALERPTLVVLTGDHGEALGDHGEQSHGLFAYESTLRVPLIVAELGEVRLKPDAATSGGSSVASAFRRASGEVSSVSARHIDILPTILEAVGQPLPADLPGRSLLPWQERRAGAQARPVYFEALSAQLNRGWAPLTGVIMGRDKYIQLPLPERYDLSADPDEQSNLLGRAPDKDRELAATLRTFDASEPSQRVAEDAHADAQLRSLGYLSGGAPPKAAYTADDDPKKLVEIDQAVHRGVEAFGAGRARESIQIYRQVIDRRPDMAIAYRHLAFIEWQAGRPAEATETLRRAVARGITDPRVIAQLGGYLAESDHVAEGIRLLEPLAREANAETDTLNSLGIAYARAARPDDARRTFERVLAINPESSIPLENLGVLALERGDLREAGAYFDRAVRVAPGSSRAHAGRGAVAMKAGEKAAAYESWTRAVQLAPTNFEALYNLGVNLARDGQLDRARPYL